MIIWTVKSNLFDKLRTNLCSSFVLLFSVFYEYCFHTYILTIMVESRFLFYFKRKIPYFFYYKCMFQILINIFWPIKIKTKSFGSLIAIIFSSMIIMTRLNCCKLFWWFYYADTKYIFVWFHSLICMNCFQLLFVLIILEVWLIVCSGLIFLSLFLLLPIHHLLVVVHCNHILQEIILQDHIYHQTFFF